MERTRGFSRSEEVSPLREKNRLNEEKIPRRKTRKNLISLPPDYFEPKSKKKEGGRENGVDSPASQLLHQLRVLQPVHVEGTPPPSLSKFRVESWLRFVRNDEDFRREGRSSQRVSLPLVLSLHLCESESELSSSETRVVVLALPIEVAMSVGSGRRERGSATTRREREKRSRCEGSPHVKHDELEGETRVSTTLRSERKEVDALAEPPPSSRPRRPSSTESELPPRSLP